MCGTTGVSQALDWHVYGTWVCVCVMPSLHKCPQTCPHVFLYVSQAKPMLGEEELLCDFVEVRMVEAGGACTALRFLPAFAVCGLDAFYLS